MGMRKEPTPSPVNMTDEDIRQAVEDYKSGVLRLEISQIPKLGTVYLKDWLKRSGKSYLAVNGLVSIVRDEDILGFKVKGNESNWAAKISNPSNSPTMYILGCQIRAIEFGPLEDFDETLAL